MGLGVYCHGYNLLEELIGNTSLYQIMILNVTGHLPEPRFANWFEAVQGCVSWPDPRIWCNQMGALGGTLRCSPAAAVAAGILAADSEIYGPKTIEKSMIFIQRALIDKHSGTTPEEMVSANCKKHHNKPKIMGFARPIAKGDERIPAMERVSAKLGYKPGKHLSLAYDIDKILSEKFNESMNISGFMAAFMLDQGYSPQEAFNIVAVLVSSGITACYVDTFDRPPETFLPMRCDDIDYQGPPPREVPDRE